MSEKDFCINQIERFGVFREYRFLKPAAIAEFTDWLIRTASGDRRRAKTIVDAALELDELPELKDLRRIRDRLFPKPKAREASPNCTFCGGTGFEPIPSGREYRRCQCGGMPRVDPLTHDELMAAKDSEEAEIMRELAESKKLQ
jgi:hypothetical protein